MRQKLKLDLVLRILTLIIICSDRTFTPIARYGDYFEEVIRITHTYTHMIMSLRGLYLTHVRIALLKTTTSIGLAGEMVMRRINKNN